MRLKFPGKYLPCGLALLDLLLGGCLCGMLALVVVAGLPMPIPRSLPFGVLFQDDFASEQASRANGWVLEDTPKVQVGWGPGKLTQTIKVKNYNYYSSAGKPVKDAAVEVEAEAASGPQMVIAAYGLVFGLDENTNDSYRFAVTTAGEYALLKIRNSKVVLPYLVDWTFSPYLQLRPGKNRLGVIVEGSRISLYVNGSLVNAVVDESVSGGYVGVSTDSLWSEHAEVSFSHLRVLSVERAKLEWGSRFSGEPAPPSNGILFEDDFSSEQASTDKGWMFRESSSGGSLWTPDGYTITIKEPNQRNSSILGRNFQDMGMEVEVQPLDNSGAWYGIVFRARPEGGLPSDEYRFGVYPNEGGWWYFLVKEVAGKHPDPWPANVTPSPLIKASGKNRLGVLAEGSTISLYINGQRVRTVIDESLASGQVGVFAQNVTANAAQVAFSRMTIYTVEKAKAEWGAPPVRPGVMYEGDFSSKQASEAEGWDYSPFEGTELLWSPNKLSITAATMGQLNGPYYSSFRDFGVEIEAQPEDKERLVYGIYFRERSINGRRNSYAFGVTPSGRYYLNKMINGEVVHPYLIDIALSPYINKGAAKNRLGVLAEGNKLSLYINGNLVRTVTDDSLQYGYTGLLVLPTEQGKVDLNRMTVYTVEQAKKLWGDPANAVAYPPGVLLDDDFSSQKASTAKGWIFESNNVEDVTWSLNHMTVTAKPQNVEDVIPIWAVFDNFGMEIEVQAQDKPDSAYGIAFRIGDSAAGVGWYNFFVTTQGTYALLKHVNGKWADKDLVPLTPSPYIKKGSAKNRLGVLADGPTISLYINGYLITTVKDDSTASGNVGLSVSNGRYDRAEFYLSRATIYTVEQAKIELGKK